MSTKLLYDPVNPLQNLSAWFLNHNIVSEPVDAFGLALLTVAVTSNYRWRNLRQCFQSL